MEGLDGLNTFTVWEARQGDGGGMYDYPSGYYLDQKTAGKVSKDAWGGEPRAKTVIDVGGRFFLVDSEIEIADHPEGKSARREKVLAKLSDEDKELLGIKN